MRLRSDRALLVGSVTTRQASAPVREAMTGQPTPGEPSTRTSWAPSASAAAAAALRTLVTSLPEFSSPMPRSAWAMVPKRVRERYCTPQVRGTIRMAPASQTNSQTPQPSQCSLDIWKSSVIAPKRQCSRQAPHWTQASGSSTGVSPLTKSVVSRTSGESTMCRSAASTSQSARTFLGPMEARAAVTEVLPVPPLPLTITSCFMSEPPVACRCLRAVVGILGRRRRARR